MAIEVTINIPTKLHGACKALAARDRVGLPRWIVRALDDRACDKPFPTRRRNKNDDALAAFLGHNPKSRDNRIAMARQIKALRVRAERR
jgi:hypothetical protein